MLLALVAWSPSARADDQSPDPVVIGTEQITVTIPVSSGIAGEHTTRPDSSPSTGTGPLAYTGSGLLGPLEVGLVALTAGVALLYAGRRHTQTSTTARLVTP